MPKQDEQEDIIQDEAVDFLAQIFADTDYRKNGYAASPRWWCLRDDLKQKFRQQARREITEWAARERETANRMNAL